jgi:hypothetical protein
MPADPFPVCLFAFTPDCIQSVAIGCRASTELRDEVRSILDAPEFRHVELSEAFPDDSDYRVELVPSQAITPAMEPVRDSAGWIRNELLRRFWSMKSPNPAKQQ